MIRFASTKITKCAAFIGSVYALVGTFLFVEQVTSVRDAQNGLAIFFGLLGFGGVTFNMLVFVLVMNALESSWEKKNNQKEDAPESL